LPLRKKVDDRFAGFAIDQNRAIDPSRHSYLQALPLRDRNGAKPLQGLNKLQRLYSARYAEADVPSPLAID